MILQALTTTARQHNPQRCMLATTLRRNAYRLAAGLALVYLGYVITLKLMHRPLGGPLGDVGEFLLVLASVTAFAVGLFADEASRTPVDPSSTAKETP